MKSWRKKSEIEFCQEAIYKYQQENSIYIGQGDVLQDFNTLEQSFAKPT